MRRRKSQWSHPRRQPLRDPQRGESREWEWLMSSDDTFKLSVIKILLNWIIFVWIYRVESFITFRMFVYRLSYLALSQSTQINTIIIFPKLQERSKLREIGVFLVTAWYLSLPQDDRFWGSWRRMMPDQSGHQSSFPAHQCPGSLSSWAHVLSLSTFWRPCLPAPSASCDILRSFLL